MLKEWRGLGRIGEIEAACNLKRRRLPGCVVMEVVLDDAIRIPSRRPDD